MNIDAFLAAPTIIQIHAIAAIGALAAGLSIYTVARGRIAHRTLGLICATLLVAVATTAFFIRGHPGGGMSWIHGFIPLTAMGLFGAVMGFSRRNWQRHRSAARGLIFGALLVPGLFSFIPGRLMHTVFFG